MKQNYSLKEISKLFNIPKSTLRYWEKEGLIPSTRNTENDYREYTTENLIIINDINFYRTLNYPIKALKDIYKIPIEENAKRLQNALTDINEQIRKLEETKYRINKQLTSFYELTQYREGHFASKEPPFEKIAYMHLGHAVNIQTYLHDQSVLAIVFDQNQIHYTDYGTIAQNETTKTILWEKQACEFMPCLVKITDGMIDQEYLATYLNQIDKNKYRIGKIVGTFVATDTNDDYFHCYIELFPIKKAD